MINKIRKSHLLFLAVALLAFAFFNSVQAQVTGHENHVKIKSYSSLDKVYAGSQFNLAVKADVENSWHINSNNPNEDYLIPTKITIDTSNGFKLQSIVYPKANYIKLDFSDKPLSVWEGEIFIGGIITVPQNLTPGNYPLVIKLEYQSCNNQTCAPPASVEDTLTVSVADSKTASSEINRDIFKNINLSNTPTVQSAAQPTDAISSTLASSGLLLSLLFVFVGGLALNLTPCVYPLIPITIGFFGGQSEGSTKKLFLMGLFFVIGMALTYSVIGVVTALSGAVFGSLLQNMWVIISIALIFVILSLSMFGLYEIQMPNSLVAKAGGAKNGYYGAFFMGLTMGIVAAPCIGPFVLGLVTFVAAKADPFYGFLMFFVLALGLGFPYLILAIFSGKIKKLPRSGEWMESVKHIFGFILLGMALYFILPLLPKDISGYVLPIFFIIMALYILIFDKLANKIKGFRIFKIVFSIVLLAVAAYALIPEKKNSIEWKEYSENSLSQNLSSNKGVVIDFYADWCIPCKELDASTFTDPKVIDESKNFVTLKANMTKTLSPEVEQLREKYKIVGVPTVLILNSKGKEVKRITGFVNAKEFSEMLQNIEQK
ncbi:MAG: protein-disulfide reductase DsbD family protein [Ignavibacteriaceae bacterium]